MTNKAKPADARDRVKRILYLYTKLEWWMHSWNLFIALFVVVVFQSAYCGSPPNFYHYSEINKMEEYDRLSNDFFSNLEGYCRNQSEFLEGFEWGWKYSDYFEVFVFLTSIHVAIFLFFIVLGLFNLPKYGGEVEEEELRTELETIGWKEIGKDLGLATIGTYLGAFFMCAFIFHVLI